MSRPRSTPFISMLVRTIFGASPILFLPHAAAADTPICDGRLYEDQAKMYRELLKARTGKEPENDEELCRLIYGEAPPTPSPESSLNSDVLPTIPPEPDPR